MLAQDIQEAGTGALYVKDDEALRMAEKLAARRGLTKVAAVRLALSNERGKDQPRRSVHEIVEELRRTPSLPLDDIGPVDKAFWDSLDDEAAD